MANRTLVIREEHAKYYRLYRVIPAYGTYKEYKGKVFYKFNTAEYQTPKDLGKKVDDLSDSCSAVLIGRQGLVVGLEYDPVKMPAPIVALKSKTALRVKELCKKKHIVPVLTPAQNKMMQYLYYHAKEGDTIPATMYPFAAEMLALSQWLSKASYDPLRLELGSGLISCVDFIVEEIPRLRKKMADTFGQLPRIRIVDNTALKNKEYLFFINALKVGEGVLKGKQSSAAGITAHIEKLIREHADEVF